MNEIINEIKKYVSELKIPGVNQGLQMKIEEAYKLDQSYEEFLRDIFIEAYDIRKENGRKNRIRNAKFPYQKHLDELQVDYLPEEGRKRSGPLSLDNIFVFLIKSYFCINFNNCLKLKDYAVKGLTFTASSINAT